MARAPSITECPHTRRHILYKGRKRFKGNEGNFLKRGERSFSSSRTGHPGGRPGGAKEVATDGCQDSILGKRGGCFPFERAGRTAPNGGGLTGSGRWGPHRGCPHRDCPHRDWGAHRCPVDALSAAVLRVAADLRCSEQRLEICIPAASVASGCLAPKAEDGFGLAAVRHQVATRVSQSQTRQFHPSVKKHSHPSMRAHAAVS